MRSRWAGIAGLVVVLAAGCSGHGHAARTWHTFAAGCPALSAPPYGVAATGKRITTAVSPSERASLDKVVHGASFDETTCEYTAPGKLSPLVTADVKIFGGSAGAKPATALLASERSAADRLGGGVDNADVPGLADGAFALYLEPDLHLDARSGNAYVSVHAVPGMDVAETFDKTRPLQQQLPALTALTRDVLTGLR